MDLFSVQKSVSSAEFCSRGQARPAPPVPVSSFLLPLGDQLFGLQLHLCRAFQGHIHEELEAAEVLRQVWRGRGRGVEEPAAGAQVALHAAAADDGGGGGGGGGRVDERAFVRAPGRCLRGLKGLRRPLAARRVRGRRAGLQSCGDSGVTDDRRAGGHRPGGGRDGGWRGHGGGRRLPQDAGCGRLEAGGVENALVVGVLRPARRAAVFGRLGAVGEAVARFAAFPGDGELVGVFAVFPQHLRQEPPPCVDEPVAHLQRRQGQRFLL